MRTFNCPVQGKPVGVRPQDDGATTLIISLNTELLQLREAGWHSSNGLREKQNGLHSDFSSVSAFTSSMSFCSEIFNLNIYKVTSGLNVRLNA